jgi:putative methionine-R-sulfoxide reductase with GAF domain
MLANIIAVLLAGLFLSPRLVLRTAAISVVVTGVQVLLELWSPFSPPSFPILSLVLTPIAITLTGYLIHLFSASLSEVLAASESYAGGLERTQAELVARTRELETATTDLVARGTELEETSRLFEETARQSQRRADLLQASAQVSRAVAQIRDLDQLLSQVTQLISRHFGFYHAGIFLTDDTGRYAVLRAANSSGGQRMLARQHRLGVGSEGIVGYVTGTGQPRIALDVGADATYFDNPDLPDTRSEMALPLRTGGALIGALDVQSTTVRAFDQEDVAVLTLMADQIATAIENARLFEQAQAALAEAEGAQRHYLRQEWDSFLGGRSRTRFPQSPPPGRKR